MPPDRAPADRERLVEEMLDAYFRGTSWRDKGENTSVDLRIDMSCALKVAEAAFARREGDAVAAEWEACARVAEQGHCTASGCNPQTTGHTSLCPKGIAAAIRAHEREEGGR